MKFSDLGIGQKIMLGFGVPILLFSAFGIWLWAVTGGIASSANQSKNEGVVFAMLAKDMDKDVVNVQQFLSDISATRAQDGLDDGFKAAQEHSDSFNSSLSKFEKKYAAEGDQAGLKKIQAIKVAFGDYYAKGIKMAHAYINGGPESGNKLMGDFDKASEGLQEALAPFVKSQLDEMDSELSLVTRAAETSRIVLFVLTLLIIALTGFLAVRITRSITRPLLTSMEVARKISEGDLSSEIVVTSQDETGRLLASLKTMQDAITQTTGEIRGVIEAVALRGDLSTRIDLNGKQGYNKTLSELTNQFSDITDSSLKDVMRVTKALAAGDLSQRINKDYVGLFGETKTSLNATADTLDSSLRDIMRVTNALAEGDLTQNISKNYSGLFEETKIGVNATVSNLRELVEDIQQASENISNDTKAIAQGNIDLSRRTETQATSLEQTAASMEEITSTVKLNADNARTANQLAISASDVADEGGMVVEQVIGTMNSINASSRAIVEIISVIDGIAFQTNILALNAAVEAARAGEQGRGFAVVATEVRTLAQRSAAAAKEIKVLIDDSVSKVMNGSKQVEQAGETMENIANSIKRVTAIMAEISSASAEQSLGIEQMNQAITQIDEVTHQNATLVEKSTAAAVELEAQTQNLTQSVSVFKLNGHHPAFSRQLAA